MGNIILEKEELKEDIKLMKHGSVEQMALVTYYSLGSYFKSLLAFGSKSKITRDNLNVIKEMFGILRTERHLLNYILKIIDKVDIEAALDVIEMLDSLNDKTVQYYYEVIDEIEEACEWQDERHGIRKKKYFPTLTQSDTYAKKVVALAENFESLKGFLDYEPEFWTFIKPYFKKVNVNLETMQGMFYTRAITDENNIVVGIDLLVPEVVDLKSALLAIKMLEKAHHIYEARGKDLEYIANDDEGLMQKYEDEFLRDKIKTSLKLKK